MGELSGKLQIPRKDPTSSSSSTAAAAAGFMQEEETQGSSTVEALGSVTRSSSSCIAELAPMGTSRRPRHCNVQTPRDGQPAGTGLLLATNKVLGSHVPKCVQQA